MRTIIITGGTSGIGKALAAHYTARGELVIAVGSSQPAGRRLLEEVPGARFVQADLSSLRQTHDLVAHLNSQHPMIDALVLGAFRFNPARVQTPEGLEHTFALYVLSRRILADGLLGSLAAAPTPVIVNLCGVGSRAGRIQWDDLQLTRGYRGFTATMQATRANELLGAWFAQRHGVTGVRYVLHNPLFVATGLHKPFKQPLRAIVAVTSALFAQPVATAVPPIARHIDQPPDRPLSAFRRTTPIDLTVDPAAAQRFDTTVNAIIRTPSSASQRDD
jgi:NAD(P)-dependent dehydrogenase (short-subunit alcohol dehydrogenase family)